MAPIGSMLSEFRDESGNLLPAEEALLQGCRSGVFTDSSFTRPTEPQVNNRIRSAVLRILCMGSDATAPIHPHGVQVIGAWVDGKLDLEGVVSPYRIALFACEINGGIVLRGMSVSAIYLNGTHADFLDGQRLKCRNDVHLSEGFCSRGLINLKGARIHGDLDCNGGSFFGGKGTALDLDGAVIGGSVRLGISHADDPVQRRAFLAKGKVTLAYSSIQHELNFQGGKFYSPGGVALSANGATIGGNIDGTILQACSLDVLGEMQLQATTVRGDVNLSGARIRNTKGDALCADSIEVRGDIHLDKGFWSRGEVRLLGAKIGGDLALDGGKFCNKGHDAIDASNATIGGELFLCTYTLQRAVRDEASLQGTLKLLGARLFGIVDSKGSWPATGLLRLDGCTYRRFTSGSPASADLRLCWLKRQAEADLTSDFRPQPWEQCASTLLAMGHEGASKTIRVEKRVHMRGTRWKRAPGLAAKFVLLPEQFFDWLLQVVLGYGYKTTRALWWILGLWLTGASIFTFLPNEIMAPTDSKMYLDATVPKECRVDWISFSGPTENDEAHTMRRALQAMPLGLGLDASWKEICARRVPSEYSSFQPVIYSLDLVLPLTDLRQERDWSPRISDADGRTLYPLFGRDSRFGLGNLVRLLEWFMILAGWTISLFIAAGVTGIAKRDS